MLKLLLFINFENMTKFAKNFLDMHMIILTTTKIYLFKINIASLN
jgi:hypothetical protein